MTPDALYRAPNALAPHYSRFRVSDRLLLTGHSHQAWPDCGFEAQGRAWLDAAEWADEKWSRAEAKAEEVRAGFRGLLGDPDGLIGLGGSTHDLLVRFLSALPLRARPRLLTTDGEFHTIRRQLDRLAEEGMHVDKVAAHPAATVGERLAGAVDDRTAAVLVSSVFFETGHVAGALGQAARAAWAVGAELLVDVYHSLNVVPFSVPGQALERAYVLGGGYKYCQLGEGNCFLRFPADCALRPVVTGWFAEFGQLAEEHEEGTVRYHRGTERFAGATYDPTSHYRGAAVFGFFRDRALTPSLLRAVSQHQVGLLIERFDALDADPRVIDRDRSVDLEAVGGFLALRSPRASELHRLLRARGVLTDYRSQILRLGPAPYLSDQQLHAAADALGEAVRAVR